MTDIATRPRRGRPPKIPREHGDTREALLRCGMEVLTTQGMSATGIDAVLKRVGVPKGSFYHYFDSKDRLFVAILRARDEAVARDGGLRAGVRADLISVTDARHVTSSHGIRVVADLMLEDTDLSTYALLFLPDGSEREALVQEDAYFIPAYLGPAGWVGLILDAETDWDEVAELLDTSYRQIAPKRSVAKLGPL